MMSISDQPLSRHRLPQPYRALLIVFWLLPILLGVMAIGVGRGFSPAFFDPRFILLIALMSLPAFYIWQEGVDVFPEGLYVRVYVPRYYTYDELWTWRQERGILTVWHDSRQKVLECHGVHLTDFEVLVGTLRENITT